MIEPTDEIRRVFADAAGWPPAPWMFGPDVERGIAAVLALAERDLHAAIAEDIRQALAADEADSDVSSGEAIWEQSGYRRGLAAAAEIAATPPL